MDVNLFASIAVSDLERADGWYNRFRGGTESFTPNDTERVRAVAEHRYLYVELQPEHAGHAMVTLFVEDFDGIVGAVAQRGIDPEISETYENGVRKVIYRGPDGNEVGAGGAPVEPETKL